MNDLEKLLIDISNRLQEFVRISDDVYACMFAEISELVSAAIKLNEDRNS